MIREMIEASTGSLPAGHLLAVFAVFAGSAVFPANLASGHAHREGEWLLPNQQDD